MTQIPAETLWHPAADALSLVEIFRALADPTRLAMVKTLAAADPTELTCRDFGCTTKQLATHHLKTLREAGITATREDGRFRYTRLRRETLEARFPGLLTQILAQLATGPHT